jgi:hypothetical protein
MQWNQLQTKTDRRHIAEPDRAKLRWQAPPPLRPASSSHASTRTSKRPCVPAINAAVTELGWAGPVGAACVVVGWN